MIKYDDIGDEEIRIVSENENKDDTNQPHFLRLVIIIALLILLSVGLFFILHNKNANGSPIDDEPGYFEMLEEQEDLSSVDYDLLFGTEYDDDSPAFCETKDTLIDTVLLRIYHPINATPSLLVGDLSDIDTDNIVFAAQAADIRADNGKIVGAFVQNGQPLAWGLSKKGFCAIINGEFTIGMSEDTPLFSEAISSGGYFFRQYALVSNNKAISNAPANVTTRRGLCERNGDIFVAETLTPASMNTFAESLVRLEVTNAVCLVGGSSWGWSTDKDCVKHEFGQKSRRLPRYTSYIVWASDNH